MPANFKPYIPPKQYNEPMDDRAIQRELDQERLFHRLFFRRTTAICNCGKSFVDPTKGDIRWRHDAHIKEVLSRLEDRLRGLNYGE